MVVCGESFKNLFSKPPDKIKINGDEYELENDFGEVWRSEMPTCKKCPGVGFANNEKHYAGINNDNYYHVECALKLSRD